MYTATSGNFRNGDFDRSCAFEPRDAFGARTNGGDARAFFVIADLVMIAAFLLELVERSNFGPMKSLAGAGPVNRSSRNARWC